MDDILDEPDKPYGDVNEDNLLLNIWFHPRQTIQYILDHCPRKYFIWLMVLSGIVRTLDRMIAKNAGDDMSLLAIILVSIFVGAALGWITFYIFAVLLNISGNWLKGSANADNFVVVLAWSSVPGIASIPFFILQVALLGQKIFISDPGFTRPEAMEAIIFGVIDVILGIWSLVIFVAGVAQVQNFSIGKAILNMVLAILVLAVPIILIFLLFMWLSKSF